MRLLKSTISFFLLALILSGGVAQAKKVQMKYQGMDRNNDGVITREEWRGDSDTSFNNHDWNGDGVLSGDEVRPGATRSQGTDSFYTLDRNNNGIISRAEWPYTSRAFEELDFNRDQKITRNEFNNQQQYPVSVFRELDQNSDGRISRGEWRSTVDSFNSLDINRDNLLSENEFNGQQSGGIVGQIFQEIFRSR